MSGWIYSSKNPSSMKSKMEPGGQGRGRTHMRMMTKKLAKGGMAMIPMGTALIRSLRNCLQNKRVQDPAPKSQIPSPGRSSRSPS